MKTRHRFSPFLGVQRENLFRGPDITLIKSSSGFGGAGVGPGMLGRREAAEVEAEGTKTMSRKE